MYVVLQSSLSWVLLVVFVSFETSGLIIDGMVELKISCKDTGNGALCWGHEAPYEVAFIELLYVVIACGNANLRFPILDLLIEINIKDRSCLGNNSRRSGEGNSQELSQCALLNPSHRSGVEGDGWS